MNPFIHLGIHLAVLALLPPAAARERSLWDLESNLRDESITMPLPGNEHNIRSDDTTLYGSQIRVLPRSVQCQILRGSREQFRVDSTKVPIDVAEYSIASSVETVLLTR